MIFPPSFPKDKERYNKNNPEMIVYDALKPLSSEYDIFYSQTFRATSDMERSDYEIDFIVIKPKEAMLLIEVKGGLIQYDGEKRQWYQNGREMKKAPTDQVISCMSSLIRRYPSESKKMPIGWTVCFPQCEIINNSELPTNLNRYSIIDQKDLTKMSSSIEKILYEVKNEFKYKAGLFDFEYKRLKRRLLRGLGFVKRLSTHIELDEKIFIKLTEEQIRGFRQGIDNKKLVVNGPAGSGKTILAKELAKEIIDKGDNVLFLCFNKALSTSLRKEFNQLYPDNNPDNNLFEISTFHHLARNQIDDGDWFKENKKGNDFWELLVPAKLESVPDDQLKKFDAVIIDEGQDFKEFWFELIERHLNPDGRFVVFLDQNQDIFNHYTKLPEEQKFVRFKLSRNCRNSKMVIQFLREKTGLSLEAFDETPLGGCVVRRYNDGADQLRLLREDVISLIEQDKLLPNQILILIHSGKKSSCLSEINAIGKYPLKSAYRPKDIKKKDIIYATIDIFKGLESDVVFSN